MSQPSLERVFAILLLAAVLNAGILSVRYTQLRRFGAPVGTGICSFTDKVDCDKVLVTPQARAFFVPNAYLGLSFFLGCAIFWFRGKRLPSEYKIYLNHILLYLLGLGILFTLVFWWLLLHLPALCPLCPWNHLLIYLLFGCMWKLIKMDLAQNISPKLSFQILLKEPIVRLAVISVSPFVLIHLIWLIQPF
jgi:uncharacterized membrane protein